MNLHCIHESIGSQLREATEDIVSFGNSWGKVSSIVLNFLLRAFKRDTEDCQMGENSEGRDRNCHLCLTEHDGWN